MKTLQTLLLASLLALAGCPADSEPAPPPPETSAASSEAKEAARAPLSPELQKLVDLARAIQADPDKADALLSAAGMTIDSFEAAMYALAKDPEQSVAFQDAL